MTKYSVGIDLGTTNSSLAWIDNSQKVKKINFLPIPQLISDGEVAEKILLPSFIFLPQSYEISQGGLSLPWDDSLNYAIGEVGRKRSVTSASRTVSSAKSWLCYDKVDRRAPILPWGGDEDEMKISPLEATVRFLNHIKNAWNWTFAKTDPDCALEKQSVVVTVPASFDETARELTVEAIKNCGIENLSLLEEPQAAFYCWLLKNESMWKRELRDIKNILVCDVGGGTTDFSLISVDCDEEEVVLKRSAVGDHLLLGGDNMDMALAHGLERKISGNNTRMDLAMWAGLCSECRAAKETLLSPDLKNSKVPITVLGRGSSLIGSSVQTELSLEDVETVILEGFFPEIGFEGSITSASSAGLAEWGLPYEKEPAVTRHMADFLKNHMPDGIFPDAVMFNGGVFTSEKLRIRIHALLEKWGNNKVRVLSNDSLDTAVSAGAAYFALAKSGNGVRIGGGSPRAYYVKLDGSETDSFLCLIPKDLMTETPIEIKDKEFALQLGRPVGFSLYTSNKRYEDSAGDIINTESKNLYALPPLFTVLNSTQSNREIKVFLRSVLTEIGTLEIRCVSKSSEENWKLNFELGKVSESEETQKQSDTVHPIDKSKLSDTKNLITEAFSKSSNSVKPRGLFIAIEDLWGQKREDFSAGLNRNIFDTMLETLSARRRDESFEASWFNIAGYTLRPGFGYPLDDWRIDKISSLAAKWLQYNKDTQARLDWWVFWRRCAGGLHPNIQELLFGKVSAWILPGHKHVKTFSGPSPSKNELTEIFRMASSFEKIDVSLRKKLGIQVFDNLKQRKEPQFFLWCLSRIAGRLPVSGPANLVLPAQEVSPWVEFLLSVPQYGETLLMTLSRMSAVTGDRLRDIDDGLRAQVIDFLRHHNASQEYLKPVCELVENSLTSDEIVFGETLPHGLKMVVTQ